MNKTTEALNTDNLGDAEVGEVPGSRLVIAKGPKFLDEYMAQFVMPRRWDTAQMVLAQLIRNTGRSRGFTQVTMAEMAKQAYAFADEMMLNEAPSVNESLPRYWERYLTRQGDADRAMEAMAEEMKDYSL